MTILDEIFAAKQVEIDEKKRARPLGEMRRDAEGAPVPNEFGAALETARLESGMPALIAEVKFASPSKGILVRDPDPVGLARNYRNAGAAAISVLTDEKYFHGCLEYLVKIHREVPDVPLLRKDFICDPYQVYEARAAGASAVLLIAAYLGDRQLAELHALSKDLGMAALVEVHDRTELQVAMKMDGLSVLGVNNRDLRTFSVDLQTCLQLRKEVPADICFVAESGIHHHEDVQRLAAAGVDAMLIGEALVTAPDLSKTIRDLIGRTGVSVEG